MCGTQGLLAASLSLLVVLACASDAVADQAREQALIDYNINQVKERLTEPELAEFRGVFFSERAGVPVACGEVNVRSSAGRETGFLRFVGAGSLGAFLPFDVDDFDGLWRHFCG